MHRILCPLAALLAILDAGCRAHGESASGTPAPSEEPSAAAAARDAAVTRVDSTAPVDLRASDASRSDPDAGPNVTRPTDAARASDVGPASSGRTIHVATTGSDNMPCPSALNPSTPRRTIASGLACLSGGDTLLIRSGTYAEAINNTIPSGTSWSSATTIRGEARGAVILKPRAADVRYRGVLAIRNGARYIVIDGLVIDAADADGHSCVQIGESEEASPVSNIRIQNSVVRNALHIASCMGTAIGSSDIQLINSEVTGCIPWDTERGHTLGSHGIYWHSSDSLIEGNYFHDIDGLGMQIYDAMGRPFSNVVVRNNRVMSVRHQGILLGASVSNALVVNNVVAHSADGITTAGSNTRVLNNTIYDSTYGRGVRVRGNGHRIINNIIVNSRTLPIWFDGGSAAGNEVSNNLTTDAGFLDAAAGDFRLSPESPAIDRGAALPEVTADIDGVTRPQRRAPDIGAYELR